MKDDHNLNLKQALSLVEGTKNEEESLYNYYCAKIYKDAEDISKNHKNVFQFPKDLFIEQSKHDFKHHYSTRPPRMEIIRLD
jgi:hypothetical protein